MKVQCQDIQEIVAYAGDRGIRVLPEADAASMLYYDMICYTLM